MQSSKQVNGGGNSASKETTEPKANGTANGTGSVAHKQPNGLKSILKKPSTEGGELNGGVAVTMPSWKGPQQDATTSVVNGDPFKKTAGAANGTLPSPIAFLNRDSEADDEPSQPTIVSTPAVTEHVKPQSNGKQKVTSAQQPVGTRGAKVSPTRALVFTTDVAVGVSSPGGHYLKTTLPLKKKGMKITDAVDILNKELGWATKTRGSTMIEDSLDSSEPQIIFSFDDIREAAKAVDQIGMINGKWEAHYVTQQEFAAALKLKGAGEETSFFDGQVVFAAQPSSKGGSFDDSHLQEDISKLALRFGDILGVASAEIVKGTWTFKAEYFRISDAKKAILALAEDSPAQIKSWSVYARQRQLTPEDDLSVKPLTATPRHVRQAQGTYFESPTRRTAYRVADDGSIIPMPPPTKVPRAPVGALQEAPHAERAQSDPWPRTPHGSFGSALPPRSGSYPTTNYTPGSASSRRFNRSTGQMTPLNESTGMEPQTVSREKIVEGHDVRTTIMCRNLPIDMQVDRFLTILNHANRGRYNFSYLRMDFSRGTNVGYGFVNFVTPDDVLKFLDAWEGHPWCPELPFNPHKGPRLAEFAYAVCQDQDGCILKFRNSAVLEEMPNVVPRLWYTKEDTHLGWEDKNLRREAEVGEGRTWPEVDNPAKAQRSRDNAGTIGLFASPARGHGGHGGHGGRGGRGGGRGGRGGYGHSQYDRGTLSQINEDEAYQMSQHHNQGYGPMFMGSPPQQMYQMGYPAFAGHAPGMFNNGYGHMNQDPFAGVHGFNDFGQFNGGNQFNGGTQSNGFHGSNGFGQFSGGNVSVHSNGSRVYSANRHVGGAVQAPRHHLNDSLPRNGGGYAYTIQAPTQFNGDGYDDAAYSPKDDGYGQQFGNGYNSHR
ncbi:uncharacterized protein LTR77_008457 [Saxophila tyrrhenica]|uniref:Mei2-like C-terminal RNA recognition motif domain-containing protein n=1 Tax=Saxophila tyrrhenica TaxID=1690608 RepID=A0AAV9P1T8_9PEZI|nr:hypothetical protein LTR77_008457 [Saxophila tyrrhenica]